MSSDAMAHNRWHKQNDDHARHQPDRTDNEVSWQRQVNCTDRQECQEGLAARFGPVDALW
jgi:hypothetical protein